MRALAVLLSLSLLSACASQPRVEDPGAQAAVDRDRGCKPLFTLDRDEAPRHSCWHRLWEAPAALVVYPAALAVGLAVVTAPIWVPIAVSRK